MLLRGSSQNHGQSVNLNCITDTNVDSGVAHGTLLVSFSEAVLGCDDAALEFARRKILDDLGPEALCDSAAVVATFQQMDRIADGTGIPLDEIVAEPTQDFRAEIGLNSFSSAQNTLSR